MNVNIINPFLNATLEIINELAGIGYEVEKPYIKKDEYGRGDITGIIGLSGSVKGTVAVTFDENTVLYIVSKVLHETFTKVDDMVIDTAGELTNMITGRAIDKLAKNGFDLMLSVPTVVHGKNHRVSHHTEGPKIAIPFSSFMGKFTVEVSFDKEPVFPSKK